MIYPSCSQRLIPSKAVGLPGLHSVAGHDLRDALGLGVDQAPARRRPLPVTHPDMLPLPIPAAIGARTIQS